MPLPNFLIIGAAKAGTTTLYDWLRQHPAVFMPTLKEPRFFAYEGQPGKHFPIKSLHDYQTLFDAVTDETAIGEASPAYLHTPGAAGRIQETIPWVRLIVSLRDPVERARSLYEMRLRNEDKNAGRSFLEALDADAILQQGYYPFLKAYFDAFERAALRIFLLEDIERDPASVVRLLFGFLGVDSGFLPDVSRISNVGGLPRSGRLYHFFRDTRVRRLGRILLPKPMYDRARRLSYANLRKRPITPDERARALERFRDDILRTQDLIDRDLTAWLRT